MPLLQALSYLLLTATLLGSCTANVCPSQEYLRLRVDKSKAQYFALAHCGLQHPFVDASPRRILLSSPRDGCSLPDGSPPPQSILLAERGNCTFQEKAQIAADLQAVGLIIINNSSDCLYPVFEGNDTEELSHLFIASAPLDEATHALIDAAASPAAAEGGRGALATYSSIRTAVLDPAALVLLGLAVVTIIAAAAWAGSEFKRALALTEHADSLNASSEGQLSGSTGEEGMQQAVITIPAVLTFVAATSVVMFILFFIINKYIFYVFLVLFAYGSAVATAVCMHAAVAEFRPVWLQRTVRLRPAWDVGVVHLVAGTISVAMVLTWLLFRHASLAWVLQNALGMCFIAFLLQTVALPSGCVASVFLAALFCYDVFMVFITPLFMPRGDSVMVRVATGGDTHEVLPMLLVMPRLLPPIHTPMMLGYGDVAVPGLLIMMLRRFDIATGRGAGRHSYTLWTVIAYVVGIALTDAALATSFGGSQGQPALLYLVPCTLGTAWVLAWMRGDCRALWRGQVEDFKDHASGEDVAIAVHDGDGGAQSEAESSHRGTAALEPC